MTQKETVYPTSPFPTPLKKPKAPSDSAPSRGFIWTRVSNENPWQGQLPYEYAFHRTGNTTCEGFSPSSYTISMEKWISRRRFYPCRSTYIAWRGLFRRCVIRLLAWYSESNVAAERPARLSLRPRWQNCGQKVSHSPFPTLLVNLVTLSLTPKTVFFTKLAAPCKE